MCALFHMCAPSQVVESYCSVISVCPDLCAQCNGSNTTCSIYLEKRINLQTQYMYTFQTIIIFTNSIMCFSGHVIIKGAQYSTVIYINVPKKGRPQNKRPLHIASYLFIMSLSRNLVDNRKLFTDLVTDQEIDEETMDKLINNLSSPVNHNFLFGTIIIKVAKLLYDYSPLNFL